MKNEEYTYLGGLMQGIGSLLTGMKTTIKVYFRKKVTEQYPENRAELKMFDRFRGTLTMPHNENNEHRCVACGLCQMACPNDTIKVTSETVETEEGKRRKYWQSMSTTSARVSSASYVSMPARTTQSPSTRYLSMPYSTGASSSCSSITKAVK